MADDTASVNGGPGPASSKAAGALTGNGIKGAAGQKDLRDRRSSGEDEVMSSSMRESSQHKAPKKRRSDANGQKDSP